MYRYVDKIVHVTHKFDSPANSRYAIAAAAAASQESKPKQQKGNTILIFLAKIRLGKHGNATHTHVYQRRFVPSLPSLTHSLTSGTLSLYHLPLPLCPHACVHASLPPVPSTPVANYQIISAADVFPPLKLSYREPSSAPPLPPPQEQQQQHQHLSSAISSY